MSLFSAAVIGLGQIGMGYDYGSPDRSTMITHASGFAGHGGFSLAAAVDPDPLQRERFFAKYDRPAYSTVAELLAHCSPDVLSLAVPTAAHCRIFGELVAARPRAILCEKPIAANVADAGEMLALAEASGCSLLVNYMRRFEPGVLSLRESLRRGDLGTIYKGSVWYTKGLLNNGSHFIDLLQFLLGEVSGFQVISAGCSGGGCDVEPDVMIRIGDAEVYFLAGREACFSQAQVELIGTRGRILYSAGGAVIETQMSEPDPEYPGYLGLGVPWSIATDMSRYQWHVLEALHQHLVAGAPLPSDGASALKTLSVVERIVKSL